MGLDYYNKEIYTNTYAIKLSKFIDYDANCKYFDEYYSVALKYNNKRYLFDAIYIDDPIECVYWHIDFDLHIMYNERYGWYESIDKFYVCVYDKNGNINLVPLLKLFPREFDQPANYCRLYNHRYIKSKEETDKISICYSDFLNNPCASIVINYTDGTINIPVWLKNLFDVPNPAFIDNKFGIASYHDIDKAAFHLIIRWLCQLVTKNTMPDAKELIENKMDVDQWLYICDYFNITIMTKYFTSIKKLI